MLVSPPTFTFLPDTGLWNRQNIRTFWTTEGITWN